MPSKVDQPDTPAERAPPVSDRFIELIWSPVGTYQEVKLTFSFEILEFFRNTIDVTGVKLGGDLGEIVALWGQNFALNRAQGEVGVSLKKNFF